MASVGSEIDDQLVHDGRAEPRGKVIPPARAEADRCAHELVVADGDVMEVGGVPCTVVDRLERGVEGAAKGTLAELRSRLIGQGGDARPLR